MNRRIRRLAKVSASLGNLVLALAGPVAHAQQGNADDQADDNQGIAEIIVTAQRTEAKLQDTPLSIVAVGGPELERQGTDSLSGFDTFIPNVTIGGTAAQGDLSPANWSDLSEKFPVRFGSCRTREFRDEEVAF